MTSEPWENVTSEPNDVAENATSEPNDVAPLNLGVSQVTPNPIYSRLSLRERSIGKEKSFRGAKGDNEDAAGVDPATFDCDVHLNHANDVGESSTSEHNDVARLELGVSQVTPNPVDSLSLRERSIRKEKSFRGAKGDNEDAAGVDPATFDCDVHLNHANDVGESATSEPNSLWENVTSEPNSLWENMTSEPNSLWENMTSEPNPALENVTSEPNSLWENLTSEPNSLWEKLTSEPKLAADGADGTSVELSAGTNGGDHAYLETEMDEEKVGEWIRSGIERQRAIRAKTLRALNATRPEVHEARAARRLRGGGRKKGEPEDQGNRGCSDSRRKPHATTIASLRNDRGP